MRHAQTTNAIGNRAGRPGGWPVLLAWAWAACAPLAIAADRAPTSTRLFKQVHFSVVQTWYGSASLPERAQFDSKDGAPARRYFRRIAEATVACFDQKVAAASQQDRASFEALMSRYASMFELTRWTENLAEVMDQRYGPGSSAKRDACDRRGPPSRACEIAEAYRQVGVQILLDLQGCAMQGAQTVSDEYAARGLSRDLQPR